MRSLYGRDDSEGTRQDQYRSGCDWRAGGWISSGAHDHADGAYV